MRVNSLELKVADRFVRVCGGQTRAELIELLGDPDDIGAQTKKRPKGQILLYGVVEFHLDQDDCLFLVWSDTDEGYAKMCVNFCPDME